jgi:DNA polymerase-3 subunit epsilon
MRQIVLDTETTGLEATKGHRIVEIAAIEVVNRKITDNYFHVYINPQREVDEGALAVHGLSDEFLSDKPKFQEIYQTFIDFIKEGELVIHNAPFDVGFLNMELEKTGAGLLTDHCGGVLDTLAMARQLHPGKRNSLDALCERYAVDRSARTLHGALIDTELLAQVYLAMTRGQDSLLDTVSANHSNVSNPLFKSSQGRYSVKRASKSEVARHEEYLTRLSKEDVDIVWRSPKE